MMVQPVIKSPDETGLFQEISKQYNTKCDEYWNSLSYDDKLMAFYNVVKRIYKGETEDIITHFNMNSSDNWEELNDWIVNMDIHNSIANFKEVQRLLKENKKLRRTNVNLHLRYI